MTTPSFHNPNLQAKRKKGNHELPPEKIEDKNKKTRECAKRMIMDGIMPLEMVARLSGLSLAAVEDLAEQIALFSQDV